MYGIVQGEGGECHFFLSRFWFCLELIDVNALSLTKKPSLIWKISLSIELYECVVFEAWCILYTTWSKIRSFFFFFFNIQNNSSRKKYYSINLHVGHNSNFHISNLRAIFYKAFSFKIRRIKTICSFTRVR